MRTILLIILVGIVSPQIAAQSFVDPYLVMAAENSPGLKSSFNDYLASMEQITVAKALPDPQVAFGIFVQPVETRVGPQRASLGISQSFPWFGTLRFKSQAASQLAAAKLAAFEDEKLRLFKKVRISYNHLYYLNKSIQLATENLLTLSSFKELARVNFESGQTGFVSVLRVEMEEQELATKLAYLKDSEASVFAEFKNLINTPLKESPVFPDSLTLLSLSETKQKLLDSLGINNLILHRLQHQVSAREYSIKVAELMAKPSFSVGASYVNIGERNDVEVSGNGKDALLFPQVGLRIPLSGKKYKAMQDQARLEKERVLFQIEEQTNQISSQLEYFLRDHLDAQRRTALYEGLHDLAERSLSLLQTEFTTGKSDFEEVLRMERKLLTYQLELEKARVDHNNAVYNINYLVGK